MNLTERTILGHMPFVGVSYQSKEKDKEYHKRFSEPSAIQKVVETAIEMGLRRFTTATPHSSPLAPVHLEALEFVIEEGHDIELLPCVEIPLELGDSRINAYRRWATYAELERELHSNVMHRMADDPILNFRENWKHLLSSSARAKKISEN